MIDRDPCGCKHDGQKWTFICEPCREAHDARHAQARADYLAAEGAKRFKEMM